MNINLSMYAIIIVVVFVIVFTLGKLFAREIKLTNLISNEIAEIEMIIEEELKDNPKYLANNQPANVNVKKLYNKEGPITGGNIKMRDYLTINTRPKNTKLKGDFFVDDLGNIVYERKEINPLLFRVKTKSVRVMENEDLFEQKDTEQLDT